MVHYNKQSLAIYFISVRVINIEKEDKLALSRKRQEDIALKKEELQSTIAKGKQKVHTRIWKVFEESYKLDLQVAIDFALIIVCKLSMHAGHWLIQVTTPCTGNKY